MANFRQGQPVRKHLLIEKYVFISRRYAYCVSAIFAVVMCPSVTLVDCIYTAEDIVKLLFGPVAPSLWFIDPMRRYPIPKVTPSAGAQLKYTVWENLRLSTEITVYFGKATR